MKRKLLSVIALVLMLGFAAQAQTVLAGWSFNDTANFVRDKKGAMVYYADTGIVENYNGTFIAAMDTAPWSSVTFNPIEYKNDAVKYSGWNNGANAKYVSIKFVTAEATDLTLAYKISSGGSNSPAPANWKVQIEEGDNWTDLETVTLTNNNYQTRKISLPASFNNSTDNIVIRWIMTSNDAVGGGVVDANGVLKMDSVMVAGNNPVAAPDADIAAEVSVYPNPATDMVYVDGADAETVSVYNMSGLVAKQAIVENKAAVIEVSDLAAGIYFVQAGDNVTKLIVE